MYGEDIFVGYRYYEKVKKAVVFPFGYGLSYTKFELSKLTVSTDEDKANISVKVHNIGSKDGAEVVQVYVQQDKPSVIRLIKELVDFDKIVLRTGETKSLSFTLSIRHATSFWNSYKNKWASEKGLYKVLVGNSSNNIELQGSLMVSKTQYWLGL